MLCETLLKLLTLSSVVSYKTVIIAFFNLIKVPFQVVFFVAMQTLHAMFNSAPSIDSLPVELNGQLLSVMRNQTVL